MNAIFALGVSLMSPTFLFAEGTPCPGIDVIVLGADENVEYICDEASKATRQLASCNLTVPSPVTIEVTDSIADCLGLYHCDNDLVQLLPKKAYVDYLSRNKDGPFGHLKPEVFFESVLRHELAHAALKTMPCPFEACPATKEFVAYTMQIRFLPDADRAPFDRHVADMERPAIRDGVSTVIWLLAPEAFIRNAYAYLMQHEDPCGLISKVATGEVVFDVPMR